MTSAMAPRSPPLNFSAFERFRGKNCLTYIASRSPPCVTLVQHTNSFVTPPIFTWTYFTRHFSTFYRCTYVQPFTYFNIKLQIRFHFCLKMNKDPIHSNEINFRFKIQLFKMFTQNCDNIKLYSFLKFTHPLG